MKIDLIFLGDSITHSWEGTGRSVWNKYYKERSTLNLGYGGDRIQHLLWRIKNGELETLSPKLAVIMIGTNNSKSNTAEEMANGIKLICCEVRKKLPDTKILLLAIFPRGERPSPQRKRNKEASELASEIADGEMIYYSNINNAFLTKDGELLSKIMPDFLHPSPAGYEIWAKEINDKVAELMK